MLKLRDRRSSKGLAFERAFFSVCDGTQNVKRYRYRYFFSRYQIFTIPILVLFPVQIFSDTGSETFYGTKFYRYRFRDFFPVPNFSDTTRKNEQFPVPVPVPIINLLNSKKLATKISSGTKFYRYRYRDLFPVPNFSDTGSGTFFRYQFFPILVPIPPKK